MDILKIFEALNYLATIGLLVVAIYGLQQLRISKETSATNARRDALKLSNDQSKYYLETIIPILSNLEAQIGSKVKFITQSSFELKDDGIKVNFASNINDKDLQDFVEVAPDLTHAFNMLEGFSTYFISELADEGVAFKAVGSTFCNNVKKYIPIIATAGEDKSYQNLLELYVLWQKRIDAQLLNKQKDSIETQLKKVNNTVIVPVGTTKN